MVNLFELERYCNRLLDAATFEDYCPNGLQLDAGRHEIGRLATGVTASQALIEAAGPICCWCTTAISGEARRNRWWASRDAGYGP